MDGVLRARRFGLGRSRGADLVRYAARGLILTGRWEQAATLLKDPPPVPRRALLSFVGQLALLQGDLTKAEAAAAEPVGTRLNVGLFHQDQWLCLLAVTQGDPERADRLLGRALADPALTEINSSDARPVLVAGALVQRARLACGADDALSDRVAARRGQLAAADPAYGEDGRFDRAQRVFLRALLDDGGWDLAVTAWRELRQPYELAQSLMYGGRAALAAGDRTRGRTLLREAAELAAGLGAAPLSRSREIALTGRPPSTQDALTARERDVLALIADGLSNRQIAERLHISPSTAGVHVSHILAKLGAASRTEAAAIAHRQSLTAHPDGNAPDAAGPTSAAPAGSRPPG
ncbi:response regulator transcription factor [Streptomyces sp. NBC_00212]|uniref:helix-turn-helix transcriptional regulator n=1 Tax=Streptomyces sp. NBC_00212 TaxID=2975684 RepID=UPI0032511949